MIYGFFEEISQKYGNRMALDCTDSGEITYNKLLSDVQKYATAFHNLPDREFVFICNNTYACLLHIFGALCAGKRIILLESFMPLDDIKDVIEFETKKTVYISSREKKLIANLSDYDMFFFESEYADVETHEYCDGEAVFFTSGTSNKAKGIVINSRKLVEWWCITAGLLTNQIEGDVYVPISSAHIFAYIILGFLEQGKKIVFGSQKKIVKDLESKKTQIMVGSPGIFSSLVHYQDILQSVKYIITGGGKFDPQIDYAIKSKGIGIYNIYGSSEMGGPIASSKPFGAIDELYLFPDVEISDFETETAISIKYHMEGYYHNDELTKEVLQDDKIFINDLIQRNENGSFSIIGRRDNVIVLSSGLKVSCEDIENKMKAAVNKIEDVCILYENDKIVAIVATREDDICQEIEVFNRTLPFYEKIQEIHLTKYSFSYTSLGKLKRGDIKKRYLSGEFG